MRANGLVENLLIACQRLFTSGEFCNMPGPGQGEFDIGQQELNRRSTLHQRVFHGPYRLDDRDQLTRGQHFPTGGIEDFDNCGRGITTTVMFSRKLVGPPSVPDTSQPGTIPRVPATRQQER
jgi:hypothetical protein